MSLASFRAEFAECRAWERRLHEGSPSMRTSAALPGPAEWILPLVCPLSAFAATRAGWSMNNQFWFVVIPWWWLLSFGRIDPPAVPGAWEALRLPSRRAWLLSRWSFRVLPLLWLGACTASWFAIWGHEGAKFGQLRASAAAAILIAPLLAVALGAWCRITEASLGGRKVAAPFVAAALVVAALAGDAIVLSGPSQESSILAASLAAAALVISVLALPSWIRLARAAGEGDAVAGLGRFLRALLVGILAIVVLVVLGFAALGGRKFLPSVEDLPWLPALVALATAVLVQQALATLGRVDIGVVAPRETGLLAKAERIPVPAGGAALPARGRTGLVAASWALYRGRWRNLQHPRLLFLPKLLWECRAPACGFVATLAPAMLAVETGFLRVLGLWMTVVFLAIVENPLRLPAKRRLHLLGADYAAVARHNLVTGVLLAALPAIAGAFALLLVSRKFPPGVAAGSIALVAGFALLRQGGAWDWILERLRLDGRAGLWVAAAALAGLVAGWSLDAPRALFATGLLLLAFAIVAVARDLVAPEGAGRRLEAAAEGD